MTIGEIGGMIGIITLLIHMYLLFFVWQGRGYLSPKGTVVRTKDKVQAAMEEGEKKGCIQSSERKLVENIFEFKELTAEDVMIHRRDVVMVQKEECHETIVSMIMQRGISRFPVYDRGSDDVVGILATRKYLLNQVNHGGKTIEQLMYPAYFVPATIGAERLLREMQQRKMQLAIVVDEYGGVNGIVTLEDLLEEIVGNIYDEFDPLVQQEIIPVEENLWRVAGGANLKEVMEVLELPFPQEELDFDTVGGLIFDCVDILPEDGFFPKIDAYGMTIQVEHIVNQRIIWVSITLEKS